MKKRIKGVLCGILAAMMLLGCVVPTAMAAETLTEPVLSNNKYENLYSGYWARKITSYLADNGDGTFSRVEYTGEDVLVEQYDADLQFISGQRIEMELPIFGAFYSSPDSNYLIFGQKNLEEDDTVEVVRVVRYSKDWKRLGHTSVYGADTAVPFEAGMVRCVEYNGYLYVHTSQLKYTSYDGYRHQRNMTFNIRLSDMALVQIECSGSPYNGIFVSHSFNQFIIVDEGSIVTADHADGYYRAVQLHYLPGAAGHDGFFDGAERTMTAFRAGGDYTNYTGVNVGGLAASDSAYLTCGLSIDQENHDTSKQKNVYVTVTPKTNFTEEATTVHYLTDYAENAGVTLYDLHFVKINADRFVLLWMEQSDRYVMRYAVVDGSGNLVGDIVDTEGFISACPPVLSGNRLIWYVTYGPGMEFMVLDLDDPASMEHRHIYDYEVTTKPTKSTTGCVSATCVVCGEAGESIVMPPLTDPDAYTLYNYDPPTCVDWGWKDYYWNDAPLYGLSKYNNYYISIKFLGHDKTFVEEVAATCSATGTVAHYHCNRCGLNYEDAYCRTQITDLTLPVAPENHTYDENTHLCVCGAQDPAYSMPTLTGSGFTLSFEDEILVNFYYTVSDTDNVDEVGMLVFNTDPGTADAAKADAKYSGTATGDSYISTSAGIAAKEMGDDRYYCAYARLTDGTYVYSPLYQYSPKKYALNMLGKDTTSANQKVLCVAMLNYGAAAQAYFDYKTGDLMNASLTSEQQALVMGFDSTYFTGAVAADPNKIGAFAATAAGFKSRTATVSFEGAFAINYYFTPSAEVEGDMKLYVWTPEAYAAASTLTTDNASAVISMEAQTSGAYWGQVEGIAAKALDKTYYVAGVYTDASGNTCCTGVIAYSLSRYCINNANGNMGDLAQSTAMYGYCAAQFFGN